MHGSARCTEKSLITVTWDGILHFRALAGHLRCSPQGVPPGSIRRQVNCAVSHGVRMSSVTRGFTEFWVQCERPLPSLHCYLFTSLRSRADSTCKRSSALKSELARATELRIAQHEKNVRDSGRSWSADFLGSEKRSEKRELRPGPDGRTDGRTDKPPKESSHVESEEKEAKRT